MSVAFFIPRYLNSGPINVVKSILSSEYFVSGEIYIFSFESECKIYEDYINGKKCHFFTFNKFNVIKNIYAVLNILKSNNISIVHSHGFFPDLYSSLIKKFNNQLKFLSTVHNYPLKDYSQEYGKYKGLIYAHIHMFFLKKIDLVVGCSHSVKNYLQSSKLESIAINNGVEICIDHKNKADFKKDTFKLVNIGRLIARKKPEVFCQYSLKNLFSAESFTCIGDGDLKVSLERDYPNVSFLGHVDNVAELISDYDVLVSNSSAEGYPLAVLEFLAHGKPVILSDIEPHREIQDSLEKGVYILNDDTFTTFDNTLKKLINDGVELNVDDLYPVSIHKMCYEYEKTYKLLME
jgi:glycosyltransferase involved in cell wall biosynthesis